MDLRRRPEAHRGSAAGGLCHGGVAVPFVGTVVYLIVRPPEYLEDVRERELEIQAAEARLQSLQHEHCQYCGFEVEGDFLRCPSCLRRLKEPCSVCAKPLDPRWKICPYCEAEVGQAPAEPRRAIALLTVSSQETGRAQQPAGPAPQTPTGAQPPTAPAQPSMPRVVLTAGRSTVLPTDFNVTRIAITNPAVADAVVVAPREILIDGKTAGTISLIVWGDAQRTQYDVVVEQPVPSLQQQLQALFPGEDIQVSVNEDATILSGSVSSTNVMLRAAEIATASATEAHGDQHAAGAGRQREPAGAAAGAVCRGQPAGAQRARRDLVVHLAAAALDRARDHAAVPGARLRRCTNDGDVGIWCSATS